MQLPAVNVTEAPPLAEKLFATSELFAPKGLVPAVVIVWSGIVTMGDGHCPHPEAGSSIANSIRTARDCPSLPLLICPVLRLGVFTCSPVSGCFGCVRHTVVADKVVFLAQATDSLFFLGHVQHMIFSHSLKLWA